MPNFANIVLTGHLGPEPTLSYTTDGTPVLRFSLAVNTGFKDRKTCSWYRCVMFGKQAESVSQYLSKGKAVTVAGEPSISDYTNDNGVKYTNIDVRVNSFAFAGDGRVQQAEGNVKDKPVTGHPDDDTIPF